jgi:hypothetical protein
MSIVLRKTIAWTAVLLLASIAALGQGQTGIRARGLYRSGQSDAMHVLILKKNNTGNFAPVDPSKSFYKGDEIRVAFESNFDGHVYIVNVTPGGKKRVLFPFDNVTNRIVKGQRYELPAGNVFIFDEEKGVEIVQVIMSREPITFLDTAVKDSNGELGETVLSAAAELATEAGKPVKPGIVAEQVTSILPDKGPGAFRTRGIILAQGKDKASEGTYVAIPDKGEKTTAKTRDDQPGKLKTGEVAVFEIRLQHN